MLNFMFEKLTFANGEFVKHFLGLKKEAKSPNFANYLILAKVFLGGAAHECSRGKGQDTGVCKSSSN